MSIRVDTSSLISGAIVCGNRGLGVLGSAIPSEGDHGAGYAYNDLTLPADASKEIRGEILTVPSSGSFFAYEDTSFELTDAADGTYTFSYRLYVDGADLGTATATIVVGSVNGSATATITAISLTPPAATAAGTSAGADANASASLVSINLVAPIASAYGTAGTLLFTQEQLDYLLAYMQEHLMIPTAEETAAAVLAALQSTTIPVNATKMNDAPIVGDGSEVNPWRGIGVQP